MTKLFHQKLRHPNAKKSNDVYRLWAKTSQCTILKPSLMSQVTVPKPPKNTLLSAKSCNYAGPYYILTSN